MLFTVTKKLRNWEIKAQFKIAKMYASGQGVEFSDQMAIDCMNKAVAPKVVDDALLNNSCRF